MAPCSETIRHPNRESPTCQEVFAGKFCALQNVGVDCPGSLILWHPADSITPEGLVSQEVN